jgi:hypothetical protein
MPTKPLDRLMFAQGGLCFFCNATLPKSEASVEHLVASAKGGGNGDENCVACCKALNALLGSMSIKEKIKAVLNQKGAFTCPNGIGTQALPPKAATAAGAPVKNPKVDNYAIVLNDLKKRGTAKPRKVETLKGTIRGTVKGITEAQLESLLKHLQINGKVTISGTAVSYSL